MSFLTDVNKYCFPLSCKKTNHSKMVASVSWDLLQNVNVDRCSNDASGQCSRICLHVGLQLLSIACVIYLSHFEEKSVFFGKNYTKTRG